jgi:S-DNA-T family DNA segregation ATPase FtsK/SpoIIIE
MNLTMAQEVKLLSYRQEQALYGLGRRNKIGFQVAQRIRGPQVMTFRVRLFNPGDLSRLLKLGEQIGLVLGVDSPRVARSRGFVDVEVPLDDRYRVSLPVSRLQRKGRLWVALGRTASTATPVNINLAGTMTTHWLVASLTGGGKTNALRLALWELADQNHQDALQMLIIDGKGGVNFAPFAGLPHLCNPIIADPSQAAQALAWAVAELENRKRDGRDTPRLVVVVDEIAEVLDLAGQPAAEAIRRVTMLGRELGINCLVATQHPTAKYLGGAMAKANLGCRLIGRVGDAQASAIACG